MSDLVGNPEDRFSRVAAQIWINDLMMFVSRESNQQKLMAGGSGQMVSTGPKSLFSQSYQLRMDRRLVNKLMHLLMFPYRDRGEIPRTGGN